MLKLNKLFLPALLVFISACNIHPEHNTTEISGNVTDTETNQPLADVKLDLTVAESIDHGRRLQNSVYYTTSSDAHGTYKFIFHDEPNDEQQLYRITPEKEGYVAVPGSNLIATQLSEGKQNRADINMARGSYLNLNVKQLPQATIAKTIELWISPGTGSGNLAGSENIKHFTSLNAAKPDTLLTYGYYFKQSPTVTLHWSVKTNGTAATEQTYQQTIALEEYNTVNIEITY